MLAHDEKVFHKRADEVKTSHRMRNTTAEHSGVFFEALRDLEIYL